MAEQEQDYKINLKDLIEKYAWRRFRDDHPFKSLFYRKSKYYVDIRWGFVDFQHKTTRFDTRPPHGGVVPEDKNLELYMSEYENRTQHLQTYTFSTSRETTATTTVEVQESYEIGAETSVEVDVFGIVKCGAGISGSMSLTNTNGEEFSKTMNWSIDTEIKVKQWHRAKAVLCVAENSTVNDFEVKTTVYLPKGRLPIAIKRISDDKTIDARVIGNLTTIFEGNYMKKNNIEEIEIEDTEANKIRVGIVLTTKGVCKVKSFHNQHVKVDSELLKDAPPDLEDKQGEEEEKEKEEE